MSPSSQSPWSILALCVMPLVSAQVNTSNTTESPFRDIEIGLQVSNIWYSGTSDDLYFQICNAAADCLEWYLIENGLPIRGEWYYYNYTNVASALAPFSSLKLLTKDNDQLCISAVSVEGVTVTSTTGDCIEVTEEREAGSCAVIDANLDTSEITNTGYWTGPGYCIYDVSNAIMAPVTPVANGTRTYEIAVEVSSVFFSGTTNDLYLRLCTDAARTDCTQVAGSDADEWYVFDGGVPEEGVTYTAQWNTKDIGDVGYADIVTFGDGAFCLSNIRVDDVDADADALDACISNDEAGGMYCDVYKCVQCARMHMACTHVSKS